MQIDLFVEIIFMQVCQEFNSTWAWEMERKSYLEMTVECKTGILKVSIITVDNINNRV